MNDLISRQEAIDALDVLCQEHRYKIPGKVETYSQYNEAWQDALDRAEGAIGNLPSAQPEHWIPVTERLPKNDEKVLVTVKNGEVLFGNYHGKHWAYGSKVVAWMPLPEPYQAKRKKEKESE